MKVAFVNVKWRVTALTMMFALLLAASPVLAEGFYVGGGIGNTFYSSEAEDALEQLKDIDENATAWKLFGGFSPQKFFGIEGGYRHFGNVEFDLGDLKYESTTKGWDFEALGRFQIAIVDIFGKAGLMFWSTDVKRNGTKVDDDSGTDFFWGLGAGVHLGAIGVRAEWESVEVSGPDNLSMVSLSATFGF